MIVVVAFETPIIQIFTIPSGATTGTRIVIDGIAGNINVFDANNVLVGQWRSSDAVMMFQNDSMTGKMEFHPSGLPGYGSFPGIYFFTANSPGAYGGAAFIQANPDASASPQIGINSGQYLDTSTLHLVRGRIFLQDHVASLNNVDATTQAIVGGSFEASDTQATIRYTDPVSGSTATISFGSLAHANSGVPIIFDSWQDLTLSNGYTAGRACQCRFDTSGYVRLRGAMNVGTRTNGTVAATLPAAYVPPSGGALLSPALGLSGPYSGGDGLPRLMVNDTSGQITVFGVTPTVVTNISLDGLWFPSNLYTA